MTITQSMSIATGISIAVLISPPSADAQHMHGQQQMQMHSMEQMHQNMQEMMRHMQTMMDRMGEMMERNQEMMRSHDQMMGGQPPGGMNEEAGMMMDRLNETGKNLQLSMGELEKMISDETMMNNEGMAANLMEMQDHIESMMESMDKVLDSMERVQQLQNGPPEK